MTRRGYEIVDIRSHVDEREAAGQVFSRDCAEYVIRTPSNERFVLLVNHPDKKGLRQGGRVERAPATAGGERRRDLRATAPR